MIDVHIHVFGARCIPAEGLVDRFPGLLGRVVGEFVQAVSYRENPPKGPASKWLKNRLTLKGGSSSRVEIDAVKRHIADQGGANLYKFLELVTHPTEQIAGSTVAEAEKNGVDLCVTLPMDMQYAYRVPGHFDVGYAEQLDLTLAACKASKGRLKSFVAFDPRRPEALQLVKKYCDGKHFIGVKLYPALGFFPIGTGKNVQPDPVYDGKLRALYAFCEKGGIPITTHCSRGGVNGTLPLQRQGWSSDDETVCHQYMGSPYNWEPVLKEFPRLKVNLAHFGGMDFWIPKGRADDPAVLAKLGQETGPWPEKIAELMQTYSGVYTDLSYHPQLAMGPADRNYAFYRKKLLGLVNTDGLAKKVMFGSDIHLVRKECSYGAYIKAFRTEIPGLFGEEKARWILDGNARTFLGL